jgi:IS5 family transposase
MVAEEVGVAPDDRGDRAETWEAINQALLASAKQDRLESGARVRLDSTVSKALMDEPSDSTLLLDAVRVMTRLLRRAQTLPAAPAVDWRDRRRLAKKRARAIEYSRGQDKKRQLYRELIAAAQASRAELQAAAAGLAEIAGTTAERWRAEVAHYSPLIARVIGQSQRRVLNSLPRRRPGAKRCRQARSWSVCSNRTPTSLLKAVVRFSTGTSSTWPPARAG